MVWRIFIAVFVSWVFTSSVKANEVCNESSYVLDAAIAWRTEVGLAVEGWTRIFPGGCARLGPEDAVEKFLYARSTPAYLGGVREWKGGYLACVDEADFSIEGAGDCGALGLESRQFRKLTNAELDRAVLVELADHGERAQEAGLQRLLQAAGYDIRVVDGYEGRRTRRQIRAFETNTGQSFGTNRNELMTALHNSAIEINSSKGLRICNDAKAPIVAALSRVVADDDQVSGWWRVEPGGCAKAIAEEITPQDIYIHARLLDGADVRVLSGGSEQFCVAPSRFTTKFRDDCEDSGFKAVGFSKMPKASNGAIIVRLDETDFEDPAL